MKKSEINFSNKIDSSLPEKQENSGNIANDMMLILRHSNFKYVSRGGVGGKS